MPALIDLPTLDALRDAQRLLHAQLGRLRRRLRWQLILELAADAAVVLATTAAVLVFLDWLFRFSLPVRLALLVLSVVGIVIFLGVRALQRWRSSRLDELSLAVTLDRYRPGVGQQVADVLQLPDLLAESGASSSPAMVRLAVAQASEALAGSDWRSLWNRRRTGLFAGALALGLLAPAVFGLAAPRVARLSVGAVAVRLIRALAPADLSDRDGTGRARAAGGPARRAVFGRGPQRPAPARRQRRPLERGRPG